MSNVREYTGARYVPVFGRMGEESIAWDNSAPYEPLTIVLYQGNSYTSRQHVPAGIDISNTQYWALTGNFNAQIEQYRAEVQGFAGDIQANADAIDDIRDELANWIVTTAMIEDGAVTGEKIANGAVGYNQIAEGAVSPSRLSTDAKRNMWGYRHIFSGKNAVFFGDSYMQDDIPNSEYGLIANKISEVLGMTKFNFAYAGAGFGRPTNLIATQQTTAENNMTADEKLDTALVVCMAGCNDLLNLESQNITQSMITTGINNFILWASNTYPNARIVIVPFNWGFSQLTYQMNNLIGNCMNSIATANHGKGAIILGYAWTWNLGIASRFRNQVHANSQGLTVIYNHILNALMGEGTVDFGTGGTFNLSASGISSESKVCAYTVRSGRVRVYGYIRPTAAQDGVGNQIELAAAHTLPAIITPNNTILCIPLTSSTTARHVGVLVIRSDGSAVCRFCDVDANEVCCFDTTYDAEVGVNWTDYVQ